MRIVRKQRSLEAYVKPMAVVPDVNFRPDVLVVAKEVDFVELMEEGKHVLFLTVGKDLKRMAYVRLMEGFGSVVFYIVWKMIVEVDFVLNMEVEKDVIL